LLHTKLVEKRFVLVFASDELNYVWAWGTHSHEVPIFLVVVVSESPLRSLPPIYLAQGMRCNHVLLQLKPKTCHFIYYNS
jgi:hypothetical protein